MTEEKCPHNMIEEKICKKCVTDWDSKNCDCPCHSSPHHSWEELWGEELEELINDIRSPRAVDSVHIHEFVRNVIIPQVRKEEYDKWWTAVHYIVDAQTWYRIRDALSALEIDNFLLDDIKNNLPDSDSK